jgi:hypothetical protein
MEFSFFFSLDALEGAYEKSTSAAWNLDAGAEFAMYGYGLSQVYNTL